MATFVLVHGAGDAGWYWHLAEAAAGRPDLGIVADEIPGCHCVALSRPGDLAGLLVSYLR